MVAPRARPDLRRALAIVAGSGAVIAFVALGLEVVAYEGTRARWRAISERVEHGSAYDPGASDALYAEVRARRADARRNAWIAAALVIVAASCAGTRTRPDARDTPRKDARLGAVLGASVLDVMIAAAALAVAFGAARSSSSIAATDTLTIVLPALVIAALVALVARGATAGQRALGLALERAPHPIRALLAVMLLPVAAIWLSLAGLPLAIAIVANRAPRPALLAPHLALSGVAAARVTV